MRRLPQNGFTLLEVMITVAVLGVLLALAAPSYTVWIANMRIRAAADSIVSGLQLARAEAVRRNADVRFALMSSLDAACTISPAGAPVPSTWIVALGGAASDITSKCDDAPLNDAFDPFDTTKNKASKFIQKRAGEEGSAGVPVVQTSFEFWFNGLGRLTADLNPVYDVGDCSGDKSNRRCLRVTVSRGGQIRMCVPAYAATGTDPQRCL